MTHTKALFEVIRPELPLSAGLCVLVGEVVAAGRLPDALTGLLGFLVGFLISGAAMISNDYFDLEVDRINNPGRPLPSGRISTKDVVLMTAAFSVAGLASAALLGLSSLIFALAILGIGLLYNWKLKESGPLGNLMVSISVGSTFAFGGVAIGQVNGPVLAFAALALIFDLGEEIAADAMDMKGDRKRSVRSIAITRGRNYALKVSAALFGAFIALSVVPYLAGWLGQAYLVMIVPTDIVLAYITIKLLVSREEKEGRARIRQLYLTVTVMVLAFVISRFL
jgi:geranylgeranylglycerol-phosphate geranylgeranyltransferase